VTIPSLDASGKVVGAGVHAATGGGKDEDKEREAR